jgi:hypothetical protein
VAEQEPTWVARITPLPGRSLPELLGMPLGLDVWERHAGYLVVAAPEDRLADLERRRLATVERWTTTERYAERMTRRGGAGGDD